MKLGLIGGLGPESTIDYYKKLVYRYKEKSRENEFPEIIIESLNLDKTINCLLNEKYDWVEDYILKSIKNLYKSGAEFVAISSNTPHIIFDRLKKKSPIPLVSIVEEICKEVKRNNAKKVGLLGTIITMEKDFYKDVFRKEGIEIVVPNKETRNFINNKINDELEKGIIRDETREEITRIIKDMIKHNQIEGVILGCTELPLLYKEREEEFKIYDTVDIHVNSLVDIMVKNI